MMRFVTLSTLVVAVCAVQTGCCRCCPLFMGGRPIVVQAPPVVVQQPPPPVVPVNPPKDNAGPKDNFGPKDKKENAPPLGDPMDIAIAAIQQRGGQVKRDEAQPGRPVESVRLTFTNLTDLELKLIAPFTKLRRLEIGQNAALTGTGLKELAALKDLEYLDVSGSGINDDGAGPIAAFRNLKTLNLNNTKIGDRGFRDIATLDQLQELTASGLLLNGLKKDEPRDTTIKELGRLKQLRKLDLSNTNTADESARAIAGLNELKVLHAYGTKITDAGIMELAKLKQLEELRIGYAITDNGVNALAGNMRLKTLSLQNNSGITDASVKALSGLTSLRDLELVRTKISPKGRVELRKALQGCKIR